MVRNWCGASLLLLAMALPAFAASAPSDVVMIPLPTLIIHTDKLSPAHRAKFDTVLQTSAAWRDEAKQEGYDAAYTSWLIQYHPWEFTAVCTKAAENILQQAPSDLVAKFHDAASGDTTLQDEISMVGEPAAFIDWLRSTSPEEYKAELASVGLSDTSGTWNIHQSHLGYGWGPPE